MRLHPTPESLPQASSQVEPSAKTEAPAVGSRLSIDIYRSSLDRAKYLSVPAGTDLASMAFPADTDGDYQSVSIYKQGVDIESGKPAVGLDVGDLLGQIASRGFALHGLKFSASLSVGVGMR